MRIAVRAPLLLSCEDVDRVADLRVPHDLRLVRDADDGPVDGPLGPFDRVDDAVNRDRRRAG